MRSVKTEVLFLAYFSEIFLDCQEGAPLSVARLGRKTVTGFHYPGSFREGVG